MNTFMPPVYSTRRIIHLDMDAFYASVEQDALISVGSTPEELGAHLKRETDRYADVIRKGNITAQ